MYIAYKEIKDRKLPKTFLDKNLLIEILEYYEVNLKELLYNN